MIVVLHKKLIQSRYFRWLMSVKKAGTNLVHFSIRKLAFITIRTELIIHTQLVRYLPRIQTLTNSHPLTMVDINRHHIRLKMLRIVVSTNHPSVRKHRAVETKVDQVNLQD